MWDFVQGSSIAYGMDATVISPQIIHMPSPKQHAWDCGVSARQTSSPAEMKQRHHDV